MKKQPEAANKVAELIVREYSWNDEKKREEIEMVLDYINKTTAFLRE